MRRFLHVIVLTFPAVFTASPASAVERTIHGSLIPKRVISRSVSLPGDDPAHAIAQTVRENRITSPDPVWNEVEGVAFEQSDSYSTRGSHRGYLVVRHGNGDESRLKYEGTEIAVGEGPAREVSVEGTIQIAGGTGKLRGLRGAGKYRGKITAQGSAEVRWELTLQESD